MALYDKTLESIGKSQIGARLIRGPFSHIDRWVLRATRGRVSTLVGARLHHNVLVLTTTGARSGRARDVPLVYVERGRDLIVIASSAGAAKHPAWLHNLRKTPRARVLIRGQSIDVLAREATGPEREELWSRAVALYDGFNTYKQRTDRRIPVVVLTPQER